ncbi:hypothetical protein V5O48_000830 [Marasmius crinis-equi]|uniref:Mid2 domain-containing protein n=1 Tax=Marasmius crinis-equi TaxID=585013 RepID=A0ABR3G078_9AGAR
MRSSSSSESHTSSISSTTETSKSLPFEITSTSFTPSTPTSELSFSLSTSSTILARTTYILPINPTPLVNVSASTISVSTSTPSSTIALNRSLSSSNPPPTPTDSSSSLATPLPPPFNLFAVASASSTSDGRYSSESDAVDVDATQRFTSPTQTPTPTGLDRQGYHENSHGESMREGPGREIHSPPQSPVPTVPVGSGNLRSSKSKLPAIIGGVCGGAVLLVALLLLCFLLLRRRRRQKCPRGWTCMIEGEKHNGPPKTRRSNPNPFVDPSISRRNTTSSISTTGSINFARSSTPTTMAGGVTASFTYNVSYHPRDATQQPSLMSVVDIIRGEKLQRVGDAGRHDSSVPVDSDGDLTEKRTSRIS